MASRRGGGDVADLHEHAGEVDVGRRDDRMRPSRKPKGRRNGSARGVVDRKPGQRSQSESGHAQRHRLDSRKRRRIDAEAVYVARTVDLAVRGNAVGGWLGLAFRGFWTAVLTG